MSNNVEDEYDAVPVAGTTLAVLRGRSSRAILRRTIANTRHVPAFLVGRLRRRDRRLWVFGNIHGFIDSPRYLAEHLLHERTDLNVGWIAHTKAELDAARAAGLYAELRGSAEADRLGRRAGVAFFTHGFRDLDLPSVSGAYLVYLWHGTPLKRIALDVGVGRPERRSLTVRAATAIVRWIQARAFGLVHLFVAASELDQERYTSAFATPRRRISVLGSARFDVIRGGVEYERVVGYDLRARLGFGPDDHIVLWLPTHRIEYDDESWLPPLPLEAVEEELEGTNVRLLVKPHPLADMEVFRERLPAHPRLMLMPETAIDANCLLHIADELVTDYSSAVCDYVILGRPVQFFAPDVARYEETRGLYEPYNRLTGGRQHGEWRSLLQAVRADAAGDADASGVAISRAVVEYCRNNTKPNSCARIADSVAAAVLASGR